MISNYRQSSENLGVTQECAKFVKSCFLVQTNLPALVYPCLCVLNPNCKQVPQKLPPIQPLNILGDTSKPAV